MLVLQMRKLRLRNITDHVQGYRAQVWATPSPQCTAIPEHLLENIDSCSSKQVATTTDISWWQHPDTWIFPCREARLPTSLHTCALSAGVPEPPDRHELRGSKGHPLNGKIIDLCRDTHTVIPEHRPDSLCGECVRHSQRRAQPAACLPWQPGNLNECWFNIGPAH